MALARPAAKPPDETPEAAARRAEVRKFRTAVATVAVAVGCVMGRAIRRHRRTVSAADR